MTSEQNLAREALLPCPFCGGKAETGFEDSYNGGHVQCSDCGAVGPVWSNDVGKAVEAWNRRAAFTQSAEPVVGEAIWKARAEAAEARVKELEGHVSILSDREFVDYLGEPVVTSNAAYQEILYLRERLIVTDEMADTMLAFVHSKKASLLTNTEMFRQGIEAALTTALEVKK